VEVNQIVELAKQLKSDRGTMEAHWQELAERFLPIKATVTTTREPGQKLPTTNYDSTAMDSLIIFAAGLHSYMTNPSSRWFELGVENEEDNEDKEVKEWLQTCQKIIFRTFNNSNFNQQIHETYIDFGCFGTPCLYEEEDPKKYVRFYTRPISECLIMENELEEIDVNIRQCKYTVRQAYAKWGDNCGEKILSLVKAEKWTEKVDIIHSVMPRHERTEGKKDSVNLPFESKYIEESQKSLLSEGGYDEFPYFIPRQIKVSGETYGYSQTMIALPDVKTLNSMSKTILKAAQKQVDPPIVVPNDGYILPFKTTAGAVNFKEAGLTDTVEILKTEAHGALPVGLEMEEQRRLQIRRALFVDLFMTLAKLNQEMTATEVRERISEKMLILGPILGRLMNELLDPLIHRTFAILLRLGKLPPIPQVLVNEDGTAKDYTITYISPLAKAQRMTEAQSINDFLVTVSTINDIVPSAVDNIDVDKTVRRLADIYNVPADTLNSVDDVATIRATRAQQVQIQQELEMLKLGGEGIGKLAKAEKDLREEVPVGK